MRLQKQLLSRTENEYSSCQATADVKVPFYTTNSVSDGHTPEYHTQHLITCSFLSTRMFVAFILETCPVAQHVPDNIHVIDRETCFRDVKVPCGLFIG